MSDIPSLLERFPPRSGTWSPESLTGVSEAEADFVSAAGKWSIRQIAAHLADAELVGAHRLRQVIAEDNPTLIAFDQDAWTKNLDYARRKAERVAGDIPSDSHGKLRAAERAVPDGAWERAGNHTENGKMTLAAADGGLRRPRGIARTAAPGDSRCLPGLKPDKNVRRT